MPALATHHEVFGAREFDPEAVPRPVFAMVKQLITTGYAHPPHTHDRAQLNLAVRGLITCEVDKGLWMVPSGCALWIPGGLEHSLRGVGALEFYTLFIDPVVMANLPKEACTVAVSPLLRELIIAVSRLPELYEENQPTLRLIHTMLDQLVTAPVEHLHLPMPTDQRLRKVAEALLRTPSDRTTIAEWAKRVGMSERALFRLVPKETGMSFGRWRQQLHITLALERLLSGDSVQTVAFELGYESPSAFITMFRKTLGQPPARYLASRRASTGGPQMVVT